MYYSRTFVGNDCLTPNQNPPLTQQDTSNGEKAAEGRAGGRGGQTTNCRSKPEEARLRLPAAGADEGHTAATTQAGSVGVDEHRPSHAQG